MGHCPVVGGNWLQLSAACRVWHDVAKWSDMAFFLQDPFYPVQISHFTTTKAPQTITLPPPCLTDCVKHSSSIFSFFLCLTNVLLCEPNTSNLDSSVRNTIFQSSSVQCLCYFDHLYIFFLLASLRYGFFFATLPRRPASRSHLFTADVETGDLQSGQDYLMKLPVEDL